MRHSKIHKYTNLLTGVLRKLVLVFWILPGLAGISARAAELKPETVAAFDRYIVATEARMDDDLRLDQFLAVDRLPDLQRQEAYDQLRQGQVYIEELHTQEDHHSLRVPYGLIHHWVGVIFIPKATISETNAVLQDYENQPNVYKPEILRAKLLEQNGNESKVCLQLYNKSLITVVLNAYFDAVETQIGSTRLQSVSRSTRIAEVVNPGGPNEHERADGDDRGYMWRLNSYWRIEEKDGGVYVQNESIELSRTVPVILAWLINSYVNGIPRGVLVRMLTNTRKALRNDRAASELQGLPQGSVALRKSPGVGAIPASNQFPQDRNLRSSFF